MTICAAWLRRVGGGEQLVLCSDSRLSGGRNMDYSPKLFALSRGDVALAFGGGADWAYPTFLQLAVTTEGYGPAQDRAIDLPSLQRHVLRVLDRIAEGVSSSIAGMVSPDVEFLLGGYSWARKRFHIWRLSYRAREKRFVAEPPNLVVRGHNGLPNLARRKNPWRDSRALLAFGGDAAKEAEERLIALLSERHGTSDPPIEQRGLEWEIRVIQTCCGRPVRASIGGAAGNVRTRTSRLTVGNYGERRATLCSVDGRCLTTSTHVDSESRYSPDFTSAIR